MKGKKKPPKAPDRHRTALAILLLIFDAAILSILVFAAFILAGGEGIWRTAMCRLTLGEQSEHRQIILEAIGKAAEDVASARNILRQNGEEKADNDAEEADEMISQPEDLYSAADLLDKDSLLLDKAYDGYITDFSISLNPYRDMDIELLAYHSKDLSLKLRRLARFLDDRLYGGDEMTETQAALLERAFANADWEIERLERE